MMISKITHCPWCKGHWKRIPYKIGDIFFIDECDTCEACKRTVVDNGRVLYTHKGVPID